MVATLVSLVLFAAPPAGPRLDFEVKGTRVNMKPVARPPWFEPGGTWTVFDCAAGGVGFVIATGDSSGRFGPASEEQRAALVALLAKTFAVPAPPLAPGAAGLTFSAAFSGREVLGGGGFGADDRPAPVVYGDDVVGTFPSRTDAAGQRRLLQFAVGPKQRGWLRSDEPGPLVAEVARGAPRPAAGWTPLGEPGVAFRGFVSDGRALLATPAGTGTVLELVSLEPRKASSLGRVEGRVEHVECATLIKSGCVAFADGQLWALAPDAGPRALGERIGRHNVVPLLSPSGAWVAVRVNRLCVPRRCPDQLLVMNVSTGAVVLDRPLDNRVLILDGPGVSWRGDAKQEVLVVDSSGVTERLVAPTFKPAAAKAPATSQGQRSPDGRLVLEERLTDGGTPLYVVRDESTGVERRVEASGAGRWWLDSRLLLVDARPMKVIDATTGQVRLSFALPPAPIRFVAIDPGLKWLLGAVDDQLFVGAVSASP